MHTTVSTSALIAALTSSLGAATSMNLITDPGYETIGSLPSYGTVVGDFNTNQGSWGAEMGSIVVSENLVNPLGGSGMLRMSDDGLTVTQTIQIISLADYAGDIAAGNAFFDMSAMFNTTQDASGATGALAVRFYSSAAFSTSAPSLASSLVLDNTPKTWEEISVSGAIPTNAAWVGTEVLFNSDSLNGSNGYVDNSSFTVTVPEPSSFILSLLGGGALLLRRKR